MALGLFDRTITPEVTITPSANAYSIGDSIGGALSFDVSKSSNGCGLLVATLVADNEGIGAAGALWLFDEDLATPIADNAAFAIAFADYAHLLTVVTLDAYTTTSTFKHSLTRIDEVPLISWSNNTIIGYLVASGAPDWAASKSLYAKLLISTQ